MRVGGGGSVLPRRKFCKLVSKECLFSKKKMQPPPLAFEKKLQPPSFYEKKTLTPPPPHLNFPIPPPGNKRPLPYTNTDPCLQTGIVWSLLGPSCSQTWGLHL